VELPQTAANALPTDEEEPLTVTITGAGEILIQNTPTAANELVGKLTAIAAERSSDRIFLRADGANDWTTVAEIMGALNAGGFSNIGLVTDVGGPALDGSDG
jgi:biopolymer transport protein TolR